MRIAICEDEAVYRAAMIGAVRRWQETAGYADVDMLFTKRGAQELLHGVGLRSVEAIAQRAQGRAEFDVHGKLFRAKVVLPFCENKSAEDGIQ